VNRQVFGLLTIENPTGVICCGRVAQKTRCQPRSQTDLSSPGDSRKAPGQRPINAIPPAARPRRRSRRLLRA
jgi:hypothetical protein